MNNFVEGDLENKDSFAQEYGQNDITINENYMRLNKIRDIDGELIDPECFDKEAPKDLYESAALQGGGYFTKLFRITLPLMKSICSQGFWKKIKLFLRKIKFYRTRKRTLRSPLL